MDHAQLAADVLRALRGRRSQTAWSRRLGYRSNVAYRWENSVAFPTAASALRAAQLAGVDLDRELRRFYRSDPDWLRKVKPATPAGVTELLRSLAGTTPIGEIASRTVRSRFAVSRWLKGIAEPRLPELFLMVEATSQRLLDFLTVFTDPSGLPSAAGEWAALVAAREAAYASPWSQAVLRVLEIEDYRKLPRHLPGWIAGRLGIGIEEEERCLALLVESRQIQRSKQRYTIDATRAVDTRANPQRSMEVRAFWTRVAIERIGQGHLHQGNYAVFGVSEAALSQVVDLYRDFYDRVRAIVTQSEPSERVVLMANHLVALETSSCLGRTTLAVSSEQPRRAQSRRRPRAQDQPNTKVD